MPPPLKPCCASCKPSPAPNEPIKQWLAKVGCERMQELADPALSLNRARDTWQQHGRSPQWIQQRMTDQETRNKLTDYWRGHDIQAGQEFAILTNIIHQEWSGLGVQAHKEAKGLATHNLRDHMTEAELIFTALAELSTRQVAETRQATGLPENKAAAVVGGRIARQAQEQLEQQTGQAVVSASNCLSALPMEPATPPRKTLGGKPSSEANGSGGSAAGTGVGDAADGEAVPAAKKVAKKMALSKK